MITITKEQWNKIPREYKGKLQDGTRSCFAGCIPGGRGTELWAEGVDFAIEPAPKAAPRSRKPHTKR